MKYFNDGQNGPVRVTLPAGHMWCADTNMLWMGGGGLMRTWVGKDGEFYSERISDDRIYRNGGLDDWLAWNERHGA